MPRSFQVRCCLLVPVNCLTLGLALWLTAPGRAQEPLQELVQALKSGDPKSQLAAAVLLTDLARNEKVGPALDQIRDAGTVLGPLVDSPHEQVRIAAVEAIGQVRPRLNLAVDWINLGGRAFAKSVKDKSPAVRLATARAIGAYSSKALQETNDATTFEVRFPLISEMISDAREFSSVLLAGMHDASPEVRAAALQSATEVVRALASLSQYVGGKEGTRPTHAQLQRLDERLPAFATDLEPVVHAAFEALSRPETHGQIAAALIVEQVAEMVRKHPGRTADDLGVLRSPMLETGGPEAVKIITTALQRGLPALVLGLGSDHLAVRLAVLDAFEALGPNAKTAVPALMQATRDPDRFVRWAAVRSLEKVDGGDQLVAIEALAARLQDTDYEVRAATLDALRQLGPKSTPAIPALEHLLSEPDVDLQLSGLKTLVATGPGAKIALPTIIALLKNADVRVRREAPVLLGSLGKIASAAVPALQAALQDADPEVRVAAARALLAILDMPRPVGSLGPRP